MATIEFTSRPNKTLVAKVLNPLVSPYAVLDTGVAVTRDANAPNRYRFTSNRTGWVYVEATDGSTTTVGFANMAATNPAGRVELVDTMSPAGDATLAKQNELLALISSGTVNASSPVTTTGTIANIVIGDDYRAASGRAFSWLVAVPSFPLNGSKCFFGGFAKHRGQWLVEGTVTAVTVDGQPRWQLQFELNSADTAACLPGCYEWSVELRGPAPEQITKILGSTELIEAYTR